MAVAPARAARLGGPAGSAGEPEVGGAQQLAAGLALAAGSLAPAARTTNRR